VRSNTLATYAFSNSGNHIEVRDWWQNIADMYHRFFKESARFDVSTNYEVARNLLMDLERTMDAIVDTDFPETVEMTRRLMLDSMDATLHGFYAMLNHDDQRAARFMNNARRGLAQFEDMCYQLGIAS
jgi:hypothetical protein